MIENDDGDWRSKKCIEMLKIRAISSGLELRFAFWFHSAKNDAIINNTLEFSKLEILSLISYLYYI